MLRSLSVIRRLQVIIKLNSTTLEKQTSTRTLLTPAYYCDDVWKQRTATPMLEKVNLDDLYYELEQRFQRSGEISAVDVDIFANKVEDCGHIDELLDLVHKLRMTAETSKTLESTGHAVIRYLVDHNKTSQLLNVVDDRLNYGVFIDYYTANILMDRFYKQKDFVAGCRIASQLMLQEEYDNPISKAYVLLHCYNYLLAVAPDATASWPQPEIKQEPEEQVKVRVKYIRNAFHDAHFDLQDGLEIVGKTLAEFTRSTEKNDPISMSFHVLGLALQGKQEQVNKFAQNNVLCTEILDLLPENNDSKASKIPSLSSESLNVQDALEKQLVKSVANTAENDIAERCKIYGKWESDRKEALDEQVRRLDIATRMASMERAKEELQAREEKLWFFENEEKIELAIKNKQIYYPKRWFGKKKKPRKVDESYVPPEL